MKNIFLLLLIAATILTGCSKTSDKKENLYLPFTITNATDDNLSLSLYNLTGRFADNPDVYPDILQRTLDAKKSIGFSARQGDSIRIHQMVICKNGDFIPFTGCATTTVIKDTIIVMQDGLAIYDVHVPRKLYVGLKVFNASPVPMYSAIQSKYKHRVTGNVVYSCDITDFPLSGYAPLLGGSIAFFPVESIQNWMDFTLYAYRRVGNNTQVEEHKVWSTPLGVDQEKPWETRYYYVEF